MNHLYICGRYALCDVTHVKKLVFGIQPLAYASGYEQFIFLRPKLGSGFHLLSVVLTYLYKTSGRLCILWHQFFFMGDYKTRLIKDLNCKLFPHNVVYITFQIRTLFFYCFSCRYKQYNGLKTAHIVTHVSIFLRSGELCHTFYLLKKKPRSVLLKYFPLQHQQLKEQLV